MQRKHRNKSVTVQISVQPVNISMLILTHNYSGEVVLRLPCFKGLLRIQNQWMSLVVAGWGSNPIHSYLFWQAEADRDCDFMYAIFLRATDAFVYLCSWSN